MSSKTKTLEEFSDEIAKELKYDDFNHLFQVKGPYTAIHCINEAAERYAAYARKQGFDQGVDEMEKAIIEGSPEFLGSHLRASGVSKNVKERFKP